MKKKHKEIIWLLSPPIVVAVLTLLFAAFGLTEIDDGGITISLGGSTHLTMSLLHYILIFTPIAGFFIFAVRSAANKFKNARSNAWLLVYTLILILFLFVLMFALTQID